MKHWHHFETKHFGLFVSAKDWALPLAFAWWSGAGRYGFNVHLLCVQVIVRWGR